MAVAGAEPGRTLSLYLALRSMNFKPTVFVVDDDPVVSSVLKLLLEHENLAVETFASAEAFLAASQSTVHGCAIIDIRLPGMGGLQLQAELSKRSLRLPVIFLTGHGDIPLSVRAIKAGAFDFFTKPVAPSVLMESVRAALRQCEKLNDEVDARQTATACVASLTERELQVMTLAIEGLHNKEIARRLSISYRTVESHKMRIMQKTHADSLLDLARIADAAGLHPGQPHP